MVAAIVAVLVAMTAPGSPGVEPTPPPVDTGTGGPDAYGYTYIDSDTTGGPTYNWIDIKGTGTEITGLGDDDVAGPFNLGFDFPYYWYQVNQVYVGSNGYIAFHDNRNAAHPFHHVPSTAPPNNVLAPMMSDLNPEDGGSVWYWTNTAQDTFIVQYDSLRFWRQAGGVGINTFQIILSRPDSTITFQYQQQTETPYNGWTDSTHQCGIENASGQVGLNYLSGQAPGRNFPYHPELAIRFTPPDSTTYEVDDVGIRNALNDRSGGMFALNGQPVTIWAVAKNFGNQPVSDFKSYVKVWRGHVVTHFDSTTASTPNPGDTDSIVFPLTWTPTTNSVHTIQVYTALSGDLFPPNDTAKVECLVLTLPGTLTYDKGTPDQMYYWNGPGGYGCRFVPPNYPCNVTGMRIYAQSATGVQCALALLDDNGPGGKPGDTLHISDINISAPQWYTVNLPVPVTITDGAFFVGAMSSTAQDPSFAMDSTPPISGQGWEYTGVWAPSRHAAIQDVMANALVASTGINEWLDPVPGPVRIDISPNPASSSALLRLLGPPRADLALQIFDATGTLVRTLNATGGNVRLDSRGMADGIYFVRVSGVQSGVAKLVITR